MTRLEDARRIIERDIEWKEDSILQLMEDIERYTKQMTECKDSNMNYALGYVESIARRAANIEETRKEIEALKKQLSLVEFLEG